MNFSEIQLPSNKKFGFLFVFIFGITATYFFSSSNMIFGYVFMSASLGFLFIILIKDELLLPLNRLWMKFGLILGMIISPIILGIIYFGIFTPIAILMRVFGRDELRLRLKKRKTHWVIRKNTLERNSFKNQF